MCGSWCALSRTRCMYLAVCLLVAMYCIVLLSPLFFILSLVWNQKLYQKKGYIMRGNYERLHFEELGSSSCFPTQKMGYFCMR